MDGIESCKIYKHTYDGKAYLAKIKKNLTKYGKQGLIDLGPV